MKDYLRTEHLDVGYGGDPVLTDICLHVKRGEIVTLIGPNGAGKSTILKSIIRQLSPMGGTVYLDGETMAGMKEGEIARKMAVLMTDRVKPELMTCWEVAAAGRYPYTGRFGILTPEDRKRVDEALALVHGEELAGKDFRTVSDGQRQRVLLARAICQEPEVIVLDEPISFLDVRYKLELLDVLKRLARERKTAVLLSLHELELAQKLSDYVVCVGNRAIERCGLPEEIFTSDYMAELYGITAGSYQPEFGCLELTAPGGAPQVFVIGGNGTGIPVYRRLQRKGIPFAAGILFENDVELPVARALASQVITAAAFEPMGEETYRKAETLMDSCPQVVCALKEFGSLGEMNRRLAERAREKWVRPEELE